MENRVMPDNHDFVLTHRQVYDFTLWFLIINKNNHCNRHHKLSWYHNWEPMILMAFKVFFSLKNPLILLRFGYVNGEKTFWLPISKGAPKICHRHLNFIRFETCRQFVSVVENCIWSLLYPWMISLNRRAIYNDNYIKAQLPFICVFWNLNFHIEWYNLFSQFKLNVKYKIWSHKREKAQHSWSHPPGWNYSLAVIQMFTPHRDAFYANINAMMILKVSKMYVGFHLSQVIELNSSSCLVR